MASPSIATPDLAAPVIREPDEPDDDLPAVGKVAPAGAARSMFAAFKNAPQAPPVKPLNKEISQSPIPAMSADHQLLWDQVVGHFQASSLGTATLLEHGRLTAVEEEVVRLRFEGDHATSGRMLQAKSKRELVQAQFALVIGRPVRLEIELIESEAAGPTVGSKPMSSAGKVSKPLLEDVAADEPMQRSSADLALIESHPLIAKLKSTLDAKIMRVE